MLWLHAPEYAFIQTIPVSSNQLQPAHTKESIAQLRKVLGRCFNHVNSTHLRILLKLLEKILTSLHNIRIQIIWERQFWEHNIVLKVVLRASKDVQLICGVDHEEGCQLGTKGDAEIL